MESKVENIIEINRLTKMYGKARGVTDVSLTVNKGEIFGFLGPNGAGKSTTIRSMLGLIKYKQGDIRIFGLDAEKQREQILMEIGYMPSEAWFPAGMTVKQVLKLAADVRGIDCSEEEHQVVIDAYYLRLVEEAEMLCEKLQVEEKKKISDLSLGNRKKVSIVSAMQHRPKLFIFDEPTSGLDPLMQNTFFGLIEDYVKDGATCLLSTHVLSEVRNHCDRVAIMKEGKIIVTDTVENLIRNQAKRIKMIRDGKQLDFLYKKDLNELYKELQGHDIQDILIEEPSIEEIFMHFYEQEAK